MLIRSMFPVGFSACGRLGLMALLMMALLLKTAAWSAEGGASPTDLAAIARQLRDYLVAMPPIAPQSMREDPIPLETLRAWATALRDDGRWPDIDYADQTRGFWQTKVHLERTLSLGRTALKPDVASADATLIRGTALRAFAAWLQADYRNQNWWHNQIGVPRMVGEFMILHGELLSPAQRSQGLAILGRAVIDMTGQNRMWKAGNVLMRGLLEQDVALVTAARTAILEGVVVTTGDGIQPDQSFHQHGAQLQFGNYGLAYAIDQVKWTTVLQGTTLAVDPVRLGIIRDYLLTGLGATVRRSVMDINACGRQLFPEAQARKAAVVEMLLENMVTVDPDHAEAYRLALKRCRTPLPSGAGAETQVVANRYFWRSDYLVQDLEAGTVSVRLCSRRIIGAESVNDENLLGYHLADGATYLTRTGQEYLDIFPVWDWRRLPGVTAFQRPTPLPQLDIAGYHLDSDFVGGVSDGVLGAVTADVRRDGLTAKKSWFCFPDRVVCLGAGITADDKDPVVTSVNQCLATGPVTIAAQGVESVQATEPHRVAHLAWTHHDGVGYLLPGAPEATVGVAVQTGSWHQVFAPGSPQPLSRPVFSLWLDHGVAPRQASYAYVLLPGASVAQTRGEASRADQDVLQNSDALQAVQHGPVTMLAIHRAGNVEVKQRNGGTLTVTVDQPCLVMWRDQPGTRTVTVADPTQKLHTLALVIDGRSMTVTLPRGGQAGRSVSQSLVTGQ